MNEFPLVSYAIVCTRCDNRQMSPIVCANCKWYHEHNHEYRCDLCNYQIVIRIIYEN